LLTLHPFPTRRSSDLTAQGPVTIDLRDSVDDIMANQAVADALTEMIGAVVEEDSRLVRFGSDIFPEEAIERFSKGDFRRIKDFLDRKSTRLNSSHVAI